MKRSEKDQERLEGIKGVQGTWDEATCTGPFLLRMIKELEEQLAAAATSLAVSMGIPKDVYTRIDPAQGKDQSVTTRIISGEEGRLVELTEQEDPFVTFQYFGPPKKAGEKVAVDGGEMGGRRLLLGTDTVDGNVLIVGNDGLLISFFVYDEAKSVSDEMMEAIERKKLLDEARELYKRTPTKSRTANISVAVDKGGVIGKKCAEEDCVRHDGHLGPHTSSPEVCRSMFGEEPKK